VETPWLDRKHTVFGRVCGPEDQAVVDAIEMGDRIEAVEIAGAPGAPAAVADRIAEWNSKLDKNFGNLRPAG
jgi:peptidyl-prolyl cis-trans isomerase B (cyclophilin B)